MMFVLVDIVVMVLVAVFFLAQNWLKGKVADELEAGACSSLMYESARRNVATKQSRASGDDGEGKVMMVIQLLFW